MSNDIDWFCHFLYTLFLLLTISRTTKNTITIPIAKATRPNNTLGYVPFEGEVVVTVAIGITWRAGASLGVGRMTVGLGGGIPSCVEPA